MTVDAGGTDLVQVAEDPILAVIENHGLALIEKVIAATALGEQLRGTEAVAVWRTVVLPLALQLNQQLGALEFDDDTYRKIAEQCDDDDRQVLDMILAYAGNPQGLIETQVATLEGGLFMQSGIWASAATRFEAASRGWAELPEGSPLPVPLLKAIADVNAAYARGMDAFRLGARSEAMKLFQVARARITKQVLPLIDAAGEPDGATALLQVQMFSVETSVLQIGIVNDVSNGSFKPALQKAGQLAMVSDRISSVCDAGTLPPEILAVVRGSVEVGRAQAAAYTAFSNGELARVARDWDAATEYYDEAEAGFLDIAQAAAGMSIGVAADAQTAALNTTLIDVARRRCDDDKTLCDEIDQAKKQAADLFRAMEQLGRGAGLSQSITVNASSESAAAATASLQNWVTTITEVSQQRLVAELDDLAAAIAAAPEDRPERRELADRLAALRADAKTEKGETFFRRVAAFVDDTAKLLKGIETAAGPVLRVAKWVTPWLTAPAVAALFT